jgi:diadenosine tetraphosphate (Ap4A) HIT family hydrolase
MINKSESNKSESNNYESKIGNSSDDQFIHDQFIIDPRLASDCHVVGNLKLSTLLLMNNGDIPWFILVPRVSRDSVSEILDLSEEQQQQLSSEVKLIANHIRSDNSINKLNIAAIGNVVSQLHIHVIGRRFDDPWWPSVVWGQTPGRTISRNEISKILKSLRNELKDSLI